MGVVHGDQSTGSKWKNGSRFRTGLWLPFVAVFLLCFLAGKLSIEIRTISGNSALVWLPGGIALAALTLRDLQLWPAVFLAALAVGTRTPHGLLVSVIVALGSTASSVLGAYCLRKYSSPATTTFTRVREVLALTVLVMVLSSAGGAAIQISGLYWGGAIAWSQIFTTWRAWWFSDALSELIIGSVIICWWNDIRLRIGRQLRLISWEFLFLAAATTTIVIFNYTGLIGDDPPIILRPYLLFAVMIWGTLRFDISGAMLVNLLVGIGLLYGRFHGFTPQSPGTTEIERAAIQQLFVLTLGTVGVFLGAAIREKYEFLNLAERANRTKDAFLATLSHELRTPLTAILGWTQELRAKNLNSDFVEGLASIERNAKVQSQLIEDLLDVSKIQSGKMVLDVHTVNLVRAIEMAVTSARVLAEQKSQQMHLTTPTSPLTVLADPFRLQQVFSNLLSNAIKFTPPGGSIFVDLNVVNQTDGEFARIQIKDTGIGIKPEFIEHIFERFNQADSSTTRSYGGLGLGLSIVKSLVDMQQGTVAAESQGPGSTFTVMLPLKSQGGKAPPGFEPQRDAPPKSTKLDGVKVLIVDDSVDNLNLFSVILKSLGAEVRLAESVREGLRALADFRPDILLSDISMPGEDGFSFIRKVRALRKQDGGMIPAVALTAYAGADDVRNALDAGFTAHVAKPVEKMTLSRVIASLANPVSE